MRNVILLMAANTGLFACADSGAEDVGGGGGPPGEIAQGDDSAARDGIDLEQRVADLEQRVGKLENLAAEPMKIAPGDSAGYGRLHALLMETRGHVDQLSREVSSMRKG